MDKRKIIKEDLKQFKSRAELLFPIYKMYFFGSRATGKPHQYSDVDLLVVSSKFKRLNFFQRGAKMYDFWTLKYPVDFLCYTPQEFEKLRKQITLVRQAVEEGIEII